VDRKVFKKIFRREKFNSKIINKKGGFLF
jgi:hypothetical protein